MLETRKISVGIAELSARIPAMRDALTGPAERQLVDMAEARLAEEPVVVLSGPRTWPGQRFRPSTVLLLVW
jgi:hypothetical protein